MTDDEVPDVVGYEMDEGVRTCRSFGLHVERIVLQGKGNGGTLRVIRQVNVPGERRVQLTCAPEDWGPMR